MKYQFGRNSKKLSSEQIKSQMNFNTVSTGAKAFVGAKLVSSVLKSSFFTPAVATVATVATVVTLAIVGPSLNESKDQFHPVSEPKKLELSSKEESSQAVDSLITEKPIIEIEEKVEPKLPSPAKTERKPAKPQPTDEPHIAPQPNEPIENRDVLIRARPLPDLESFRAFISTELEYPEAARKDSAEGFVRVHFKINQRGIAEGFKINKSLGELFDNEAVRVLKMYQSWEPASFNGQAVESQVQINIQFEFEKPYPGDTIKYH